MQTSPVYLQKWILSLEFNFLLKRKSDSKWNSWRSGRFRSHLQYWIKGRSIDLIMMTSDEEDVSPEISFFQALYLAAFSLN